MDKLKEIIKIIIGFEVIVLLCFGVNLEYHIKKQL